MRYYIVAGEASGDLHASNLMKEMNALDPNSEFRGIGGDLMQNEGLSLLKHYKTMAFMGVFEVIANLRTIFKNIKKCKKDISDYNPDAIILVDYPGFNLRIAEYAKSKGIKVYFYISPKVWAWKESRVKKIKKYVDELLTIFPFETEFYQKHGFDVNYVGNPLFDSLKEEKKDMPLSEKFRNDHDLDPNKPIVAVLAGSRKQEIKYNLPVMLDAIRYYPDHQFVLAGAPSIDKELYKEYCKGYNIKVIYNKTYQLLKNSKAAVVTSGTATLETALFRVPQVVCYKFKGGWFAYAVFKTFVRIPDRKSVV